LIESKGKTKQVIKSIQELEGELNSLQDAYAKESTARYLARHYSQFSSEVSVNKAIEYYLLSLEGKGLSIFAKQTTQQELLSLYFQQSMYQSFIKGFDRFIVLQGRPNGRLRIKRMLSFYHLKENQTALQIARLLVLEYEQGLELEVDDLKKILFTFYNLKDYLGSEQVQRLILALDENSVEQWLRLSKLHIRNDHSTQAATVLLAALQKGLAIEPESLLLTTDLINQSGNPFIAARLLQQLMDLYQVDRNVDNFDRLFKYWYLAQEISFAADALKKSLKYDNNTKRYLDLSELYYQQKKWGEMNAIIKEACTWSIEDEFIGRANLLLGISELKLNHEEEAVKAFYNATMISGKVKEAIAYLQYLNVDISDTRRYEQITGVCAPAKG
jgi:tetratricopeptide (TPR) repeat protein